MSANSDFKIVKEKKLEKSLTLRVKKNLMSGRIFVEFLSVNPNITLQKSFQDTYEGKKDSEAFSKSIKNLNQLRQYFGIKENK